MIAVIEVGGNQFIVKEGDEITVDRVKTDKKTISYSPLLVSDEDGKDTKIGTPTLDDIKVECKIIDHVKGEKIKVFKMKAKKRYARTKGFRAAQTILQITKIGGASAPAKKTETKATTEKKTPAKKAPAKKTTTAKKAAPKKAPAKK